MAATSSGCGPQPAVNSTPAISPSTAAWSLPNRPNPTRPTRTRSDDPIRSSRSSSTPPTECTAASKGGGIYSSRCPSGPGEVLPEVKTVLSVPLGYLRRQFNFSRDVRLFLVYNLLANVGWGAFALIFNLYLRELNLREDDMGAFSAAQTLAMAGGAATMGTVLDRLGIWRSIVSGVSVFLLASLGLAFAEERPLLLVLSAISGVGLAYLFTTTMPFVIAWTRRDERQFVSALSFSVASLSLTFGSLLGGFLPDVLPGPDLQTYRWTLVAGTGIAALGLGPMFLMGAARRGGGLPDPTAVKEAADSGERRRGRGDVAVFVLGGGVMAVGAGMVFPFYNVYLTR